MTVKKEMQFFILDWACLYHLSHITLPVCGHGHGTVRNLLPVWRLLKVVEVVVVTAAAADHLVVTV